MRVYVNSKNEIKDVNITTDSTLTPVDVGDVFEGWSVARILCYKLILRNGECRGYTPIVDTRIIERLDKLGIANEKNALDVTDIQIAMAELYEMSMEV